MSASFVLDASVSLAWCFEDEATPATEQLLGRLSREQALVPSVWFIELSNALAASERRKRITREKTEQFVELLSSLSLEVDESASERAFESLLDLCREHGLTAYDAVYLDLARSRGLPLATVVGPLRRAAGQAGVEVLGR